MKRDNYIVLPGCDDTNRGDQALIWETVDVAKAAGFEGKYYIIADRKYSKQSKSVGIGSLAYILPHPSMHSKSGEDNRSYGFSLKIKWAIRSLVDLLIALPLSMKATRPFAKLFLSADQKKTLTVYKNAKAAFVKGGGFLHDYGGIIDIYKIYFSLYHINLALSMGIPVYVMPNSYGPFKNKISRILVNICLKKCQLVFSRESISKKILRNTCSIDSILSNDLAMYLKKDSTIEARSIFEKHGITLKGKKTVGITVRPYRFGKDQNAEELYRNYKNAICSFICWLQDNSYYPVLIEHVFSENYHERDIICITEIVKQLEKSKRKVDVFSDLKLNCRQMKTMYSGLDYLVGTRFHSVVFSMTENVPAIAITYGGNKGSGIMKDLGLSEYALPMDKLTGDDLISRFNKLVVNEASIKNVLSKKRETIAKDFTVLVSTIKNVK